MCAVALRSPPRSVARVPGARKTAIPAYIEPCDPTLRERAPQGDDWRYEIKGDGYRAQLHLHDRTVKVYSRTGLDWTEQFSSIASAARELKADSAVIDGEAVVYGAEGVPDFQQLRRELGKRKSPRVRYHAFDLLYLDGYDLRAATYLERKRLRQRLLPGAAPTPHSSSRSARRAAAGTKPSGSSRASKPTTRSVSRPPANSGWKASWQNSPMLPIPPAARTAG